MKQPEAPCLGCEERYIGCHSVCEKYQEFTHLLELWREEKHRTYEENRILNDIEHSRIKRAATGRMRRRRNGKT